MRKPFGVCKIEGIGDCCLAAVVGADEDRETADAAGFELPGFLVARPDQFRHTLVGV